MCHSASDFRLNHSDREEPTPDAHKTVFTSFSNRYKFTVVFVNLQLLFLIQLQCNWVPFSRGNRHKRISGSNTTFVIIRWLVCVERLDGNFSLVENLSRWHGQGVDDHVQLQLTVSKVCSTCRMNHLKVIYSFCNWNSIIFLMHARIN